MPRTLVAVLLNFSSVNGVVGWMVSPWVVRNDQGSAGSRHTDALDNTTPVARSATAALVLAELDVEGRHLVEVLEQVEVFYADEPVALVWDGVLAHWSRAMRAWVAEQDWLTLERLPAYAPELNPVELLWSSLKKRELANLAGDHLADATEHGIHRINNNPQRRGPSSPTQA